MKQSTLLSIVCLLTLSACSPKNEPEPSSYKTILINASDYGKTIYFSFDKGIIPNMTDEEAKKSDAWDMSFHRYDIGTNSGASHPEGKGGGYETNETDINKPLPIPEASAFLTDISQVIATGMKKMNPDQPSNPFGIQYTWQGVNPAISQVRTLEGLKKDEKGNYIFDGTIPTFKTLHEGAVNLLQAGSASMMNFVTTLSNKVYFVRTAQGKLARIKIVDYSAPVQKEEIVNGQKVMRTQMVRGILSMQYVYPVSPQGK